MICFLDCTVEEVADTEYEMNEKIPLWYRVAGNYSLLPRALNCNDKLNQIKCLNLWPDITTNEVKIPIKIKKNNWVYYWAPKPSKNRHKIKDPETAYDNESNGSFQNQIVMVMQH